MIIVSGAKDINDGNRKFVHHSGPNPGGFDTTESSCIDLAVMAWALASAVARQYLSLLSCWIALLRCASSVGLLRENFELR